MEALTVQVKMGGGGGGGGGGKGGVASQLVDKLTVILSMHLRTRCFKDPSVFTDLCLALSRCIDHAVVNNEVPSKYQDLPLLLKEVRGYQNDYNLQAAFMVLMMSVKSACQSGWFASREKDDLLRIATELGGSFSDTDSVCIESTYGYPFIQKVMSRFYPKMKMHQVLALFEVKSGYGAHVLDFHISKGMVAPEIEKMWLFVARADSFDTSSCIVSPPDVNFLLNGVRVPGRTKTDMCNGPQFPTDVTAMLKYGVNLLQAIGNFDGNYIIAIAVMSLLLSVDHQLQDYVEPVSTTVDSDGGVFMLSSKISLNCPISLCRLRIPVKGHHCKHRQCFDFDNYLELNSRRPYWRCPNCNHPVCFQDIRFDRKIAKVLTEVGENTVDIYISADGSWKPVLETKDDSTQTSDRAHVTKNSTTAPPTTLQQSPAQTDFISQTRHEYGQTQTVSSALRSQMFSSHSTPLQNSVYPSLNRSDEYWRFLSAEIDRQINHGTCTQPNLASAHVNAPLIPATISYSMEHHLVTRGISSPAQNSGVQGTTINSPSIQQTRQHPYHLPQASNNYQNMAHKISHSQPHDLRRDGAIPANSTAHQAQYRPTSVPVQTTAYITSGQVRSETQQPIRRMRGSLTGERANAYSQFILRPPQQSARPSQPALNQMPGVVPNSTTSNPASNVFPGAHMMHFPLSSGSLPAQYHGTNH